MSSDAVNEIPPAHAVQGRFRVPGSKSLANRALVCASLAQGESRIVNASDSDDTALMANGLNQLGVLVRREGSDLIVDGTGGRLFAPKFPIPVGNAGTTLRFLLSLAALADGRTVLEGSPRMASRPNDEILAALRSLGVDVRAQAGSARFEVTGRPLSGGEVSISAAKSSQFLSSVLMVAPCAQGDLTVHAEGELASRTYLDLTLDVMRHFGAQVNAVGTTFRVSASQRYVPREYAVEPDASSASYGLAAAAITGGDVLVEGLRLTSHQGDIRFAEVLRAMGCAIEEEPSGVRARGGGALRGVEVDMNGMPDVVPTLAVVALFASGATRILNIGHLRYKESDRLSALADELGRLGAHVVVRGEGLEVTPGPLHGARLGTHDDHRLAMSFALAGLRVPGVQVENPGCVRKSFPAYWTELAKLTGR